MSAEIQIIGGGFSGLSLAYFLVKRGKKVRVVETSGRYGGMLKTLSTPYGPAETAANAILRSELVEEVAKDLGIELVSALPSARKRFIYRGGKFRRWPIGIGSTLKLARFFVSRKAFAPKAGESIAAWGRRALGPEATNFLVLPGLSGVYAGDGEDLSASLILGRFFGGKKGKFRGSSAPLGGMGEWGKGFFQFLRNHGVEFSNQEVELPTIVALPPFRAAEFLSERAPALSSWLKSVDMLPVLSATCFFERPGIRGFGCLFPRSEGFRVLGILSNSSIFPERGKNSETWIFGGATDREILDLSDEAVVGLIFDERARLGFSGELLHVEINRWQRGIPHYDLKLEKLLEGPKSEGRYSLFGNYLGELGLARILASAKEMAEKV